MLSVGGFGVISHQCSGLLILSSVGGQSSATTLRTEIANPLNTRHKAIKIIIMVFVCIFYAPIGYTVPLALSVCDIGVLVYPFTFS